jgi:hypothetical protein
MQLDQAVYFFPKIGCVRMNIINNMIMLIKDGKFENKVD